MLFEYLLTLRLPCSPAQLHGKTGKRRGGIIRVIWLWVFTGILLISCSKPPNGESATSHPHRISLSDQYGLAYAPINAARLMGWFEEELPETEFRWQTAGNAAAIRESMLAGRLDGGFMGIPPYLIGKDRGMQWETVSAVSRAKLGLVSLNPEIRSLSDISSDMRIALPQPGSIQHILLSMAAEKELGNGSFFDNQLVSLSHPDGMTALLGGHEISAHFSSPPYLQAELKLEDSRLIISGDDAFGGPFTFIVLVLSRQLIDDYPKSVQALRTVLNRAIDWINENPNQAGMLLHEYYKMDAEALSLFFRSGDIVFDSTILGMDDFQEFMLKKGYLKGQP